MTAIHVSDLIKELQAIKKRLGDIRCYEEYRDGNQYDTWMAVKPLRTPKLGRIIERNDSVVFVIPR